MFHGFIDTPKAVSSSVFDDGVSGVLAGVLTDGDCVAVSVCSQGALARVEMMGLCVRGR